MASIEKRYIRIEDWKGNIYYPESSSGVSAAGTIVDAADAATDTDIGTYTECTQSSDPTANNGTVIIANALDSNAILIQTDFESVPFGKCAVSIRAKYAMASTGTEKNLIRVDTYYVDNTNEDTAPTLLSTKYITKSNFGVENKFVDISFLDEFSGNDTGSVAYRVRLTAIGGTNANIYFDNISVSKAFISVK